MAILTKLKLFTMFCAAFTLALTCWHAAEMYLFKPLFLVLANTLFEFIPSLQLSLTTLHPSSATLHLTSGVFYPELTYIVGNYYPEINLSGVTSTKLPSLLNLTIGLPVYALLEILALNVKQAPLFKIMLRNIAFISVSILIAVFCVLCYEVTLMSPKGEGLLVQNADGIIIAPVSFHPSISAIAKVGTDFSGVIATFVLPVYLSAHSLLKYEALKTLSHKKDKS